MHKVHEQYIVNKLGKKTAVVLSIDDYEELMEDYHDLAIIAERKDEPSISFDELKKRLKINGLI
jgi:PHD/YefM family antitoxin component YafN of YafNO toxin-antitoxin module